MPDELDRFGKPYFHGWPKRECGEHRTVGHYRAWCFECSEWCYPGDQKEDGCKGCRLGVLSGQE